MGSLTDYSELIKLIPVNKQSTIIKKNVWKRFSYDEKIEKAIFGSKDIVEISREDVLSERDLTKKIIMVLMWGYPSGGRGNNIEYILSKIKELKELLSSISNKNLTEKEARGVFESFENISGLGTSTWSKFLYFFNVSIDSRECQIYDLKIVDSLNKKQFSELGTQEWWLNLPDANSLMELDLDKCRVLFEIIETRDSRKSTMIVSQLPVANWWELFKDSTYADACLSRMTSKAYRLECNGRDMCKSEHG